MWGHGVSQVQGRGESPWMSLCVSVLFAVTHPIFFSSWTPRGGQLGSQAWDSEGHDGSRKPVPWELTAETRDELRGWGMGVVWAERS